MNLRQTRNYRKQYVKPGTIMSVGPTTARYLVLLLLGVFSLMFLVQTTQGAQSTVQIREQENLLKASRQELTTLEIQSSRLQSLQQLSQTAQTQGLVPIKDVQPLVPVQ